METEVLFVEKKPRETTKHKLQSGIFFVLKKMSGEKRKMMEENRHQGKTYSLYIYQKSWNVWLNSFENYLYARNNQLEMTP